MKKWFKRILLLILMGIMFLVGGYIIVTKTPTYKAILSNTYDKLATIDKGSFRKLKNSTIYDKNGDIIGELNTGSYTYIEISEIPLTLQNAYIAAEDQNFKTHQGVDYKATLRAALMLVKNRGAITQGGSTITQQVIKNNILSQEQSFMRKLMEILMAPDIEREYSKQEIMEFYCNSNYYGNGCYGIESASNFYFGKPAKEMTLAEAAMMAGVSNSPNNYNPVASMELATKKMKSILNKMQEQKMITEKEKEDALKQEIVITKTASEVKSANNYMSSYAIHSAALELMNKENFNFKYIFESEEEYIEYQEKFKTLYSEKSSEIRGGGYDIYTSFDQDVQNQLQSAIDNQLWKDQNTQEDGRYQLQGAGVCIDNSTGYVIAIVGGRGTEDQFNRGFLATRQPGSAIKPLLVYGPAFDYGLISPSTIYTDKKVGSDSYSPQNANNKFLGDMNIRKAMALSTNTIAYQVFEDVGQENAMKYLKNLEFSGLRYADNSAISISLGGFTNGTKVDEMARAYSTIQNHGVMRERSCIVKIQHEQNGVLYDGERAKTKEIYNPDAAYMLTESMQEVFKQDYGTAHEVDLKGQVAAAKTGTTNSNRDVWFCGFTNYYTTSVWVGNDNNKKLWDTKYAMNIWEEFMSGIHNGKEASDFVVPDSIQYRNVKKNGTLGATIYDKNTLDMSKNAYDRRPDGYDLFSGLLEEKALENQAIKESNDQISKAEESLLVFEAYAITDVDSARGLNDVYVSTLEAIEAVANPTKYAEFKTRLAKKYEQLEKTYKLWEIKITEDDLNMQEQLLEEQAKKDEDDHDAAIESLHKSRINYMNKYLTMMSKRKYNTPTAQNLIKAAGNCLNNCIEYPEYNDLKAKYDEEVNRIAELPTSLPSPEISENENDKPPKEENFPLENENN